MIHIFGIILTLIRAIIFMSLWNLLVVPDFGFNPISFTGALGVALIVELFTSFDYPSVKAVAEDITTTPFLIALFATEGYKIIFISIIGIAAYFLLG